jgi:peptidoglycan/LPS O-acetylase OafA/YrhL
MQVQKQQVSTAGKVGSMLALSGSLSAFIYVFDSWRYSSQHFSLLIAFGFAALGLLGFLLLWRERNSRSRGDWLTFVAGLLASIGMGMFAGGLAGLDRISSDANWMLVFLVGPFLALLGIAIIILRKIPITESR